MFNSCVDSGYSNCSAFFRTKTNYPRCNPQATSPIEIHKRATLCKTLNTYIYFIFYLNLNCWKNESAKKKEKLWKSSSPESPKHESFAFIPPAHTWPGPIFKLYDLYAFRQSSTSTIGKRTFNFIELDTSPYRLNTKWMCKKKSELFKISVINTNRQKH